MERKLRAICSLLDVLGVRDPNYAAPEGEIDDVCRPILSPSVEKIKLSRIICANVQSPEILCTEPVPAFLIEQYLHTTQN